MVRSWDVLTGMRGEIFGSLLLFPDEAPKFSYKDMEGIMEYTDWANIQWLDGASALKKLRQSPGMVEPHQIIRDQLPELLLTQGLISCTTQDILLSSRTSGSARSTRTPRVSICRRSSTG